MKRIVFREEADTDLQSILDWYRDIAPEAIDRILADIYRSINRLTRYPKSGMQVEAHQFRRIVTLKYHFKVAYQIEADRIVIMGIFRFQNRQR